MNKNYFLLLLSLSLLFIVSNCFGQIMFQRVITIDTGNTANAVQQTTDGGYIIVGYTFDSAGTPRHVYLIKTNEAGDTLWTRTFGGIIYNEVYSGQQTTDSGFIVAGYTVGSGIKGGLYVIKTNIEGDTMWTKAYGGNTYDVGSFIQQTNDGGYIITGQTESFGAGLANVYLLKINATGDIEWTKTYGGSNYDSGNCVKQTSDSGYIVCGNTGSFGAGSTDVYLIKTKANGDTLWTKTYGGPNNDYGLSAEQTIDGGYIITGYTFSYGVGTINVYLIKTDANGDTLWTKTYGGTKEDIGYDVHQTTDSGYIITGYTSSFAIGSSDVYLIKTNAQGDTLWTKTYGGTGEDAGSSVRQTKDGGYIIAGRTESFPYNPNGTHVYLIKTDANGNTGCHQGNTNTIVGSTNTQVGSPHTIVESGGIASPTATIVESGGKDSTICLSVGINELSSNNTISIYPNPASNELIIKSEELRIKSIAIYNVLGEEVLSSQLSIINYQLSINVSSLPSGIYFVRVADENESWVGKFVKE